MKYLAYGILLCAALAGCDDKRTQAERDARIAQEARAQLLAELNAKEAAKKAQEQNSTLYKFGITKDGSRITIDTEKTKMYFDEVSKSFSKQAEQFAKEIKYGEAGIEANKSQVTIDLNKTSRFLDNWAQKMENFAQELDMLTAPIETNRSNP